MELSDYIIYFDPDEHRYTDNIGTIYTSVTTKNAEYEPKFKTKTMARACEVIGRNPSHPKYEKYKNKSRHQLEKEWETTKKLSHLRGNERHDYIETSVNKSNGYRNYIQTTIKKGRIYTILDILDNPKVGEVNLEFFIKTGIKDRFPVIYDLISLFVKDGYRVYSEVCVFSPQDGIAGLIDLLLIKDGYFVIIDWKTNKDDITFDAGYFEKDRDGKRTGKFVNTRDKFLFPLHHIPASTGSKYTMQITAYDYLAELTGLICKANILCHIRHEKYKNDDKRVITNSTLKGKEQVDVMPIVYWKEDYKLLLEDSAKYTDVNKEVNLFNQTEKIIV